MLEALTTKQLNDILCQASATKHRYIGAYPACITPKSKKSIYAFISNTDNHEEDGEHWCAWVIKDENLFFFDSFGRSPNDETLPMNFLEISRNFKHIQYTKTRIQGWNSNACGYFCIHFIYMFCLGLDYEEFLNEYTCNYLNNDNVAYNFVSSIIYLFCFTCTRETIIEGTK